MKKLLPMILAAIFTTPAMAINIDYDFKSGESTAFKNYFPTTMSGHCVIETKEEQIILDTEMVKGSGAVDGKKIDKGGHATLYVRNGQRFDITVSGLAVVQITLTLPLLDNDKPVATAHCST